MGCIRQEVFFNTITEHMKELCAALDEWVPACGVPVYCSLDIRDSGWKISAVDVNIFPAGFNNLSKSDQRRASEQFKDFFKNKLNKDGPHKIVLVPEAHTNNKGYLENLAGLLSLLEGADCSVKLVWSGAPLPKAWKITTPSGKVLEYLTLEEAFQDAEAVLLNHDLSGGIPAAIRDIQLPIFPSTRLGWFRRRKSQHQEIVEALLKRLEMRFDFFDSWYFSPKTTKIAHVSFDQESDIDHVVHASEEFFNQIESDYKSRGIEAAPSLFIKNDSGTYGMGVVSVDSKAALGHLTRDLKQKMKKGKESVPVSQVILQEGIPTALYYDAKSGDASSRVAGEPVLYMVNGNVIGGFLRVHRNLGERATHLNLNQPGSQLEMLECEKNQGRPPLPFPELRGHYPCQQIDFPHLYNFLGKLHSIAAGLEDCPDL